jgi:hypothetical protein
MKIKYSPEVDLLTISFSEIPVDYAEESAFESEGVITHFPVDGKPVLPEIQGGRDFLLGSITSLVKGPVDGEEVKLS